MVKSLIKFLFLIPYFTYLNVSAEPWEPEPRDVPMHEYYLELTRIYSKQIQILFYGDNIVQDWEYGNGKHIWEKNYVPLHAYNYAIYGEWTQHTIWRMQNGELNGLNPKIVVLMCGSPNAGVNGDDAVIKAIKAIVDIVREKLPHTKILLLGIIPHGDRNGAALSHIKKINNAISKFANDSIDFLDLGSHFYNKDGHLNIDLYTDNKIYLTKQGYEIWDMYMFPHIKKILGLVHTGVPWEPEEHNTLVSHQQHLNFLEITKKNGKSIEIVFLGDSITEGWNSAGKDVWKEHYGSLHAVNYGISGDRTEHILWRLENGEFNGLQPKIIVLNIGTNNLGTGYTDVEIGKGITMIVENLREKLPNTKILVLGVLPRGKHSYFHNIRHINSIISMNADEKMVQFLDMELAFSNSGGEIHTDLYVTDGVHLTHQGYKVWAQTMHPLLKVMLN